MVRLVTKVSQIKVGQAQNFLLHNIHTQILVHQASYYTGTGRHFVTNKATEAYGWPGLYKLLQVLFLCLIFTGSFK